MAHAAPFPIPPARELIWLVCRPSGRWEQPYRSWSVGVRRRLATAPSGSATLHKFNGFADKFLGTPVNGLEDFYIDVTYKVKNAPGQLAIFNGLLLKAQYHDFSSEEGSIDYGTEFDFYAKMPLRRGVYVEAKYANYDADQFATDTEKFIFGVGWKY